MGSSSAMTPAQLDALLNGPSLAPPPGVVPNLTNPHNLHKTADIVVIISIVLATVALFMRIYTKLSFIHHFRLEDYAICIAWAVFIPYTATGFLASKYNPAIHQWNLKLIDFEGFLYQVHVASVEYCFILMFIKISILLQYLHIFVPEKKSSAIYWTCHALIWLNVLYYVITAFIEIFSCNPIAKSYNPLITTGHCVDINALNTSASTLNSLSDIVLLILPQISIWRLHMARKRKIQISFIFLVGIFACASSVVRLVYTIKLLSTTDISYYAWMVGLWTYPEMASGIVAACLPVSAKFFQGLQDTWLFSKIGSSLNSLLSSGTGLRTPRATSSGWQQSTQSTKQRHGKEWPSNDYKNIPDGQPLASHSVFVSSTKSSEEGPFVPEEHARNGVYVMKDIDVREVV